MSKKAQQPNIISAYKLAEMCSYMIDNDDYDNIKIDYVQVDWLEDRHTYLKCIDVHHADLFKAIPDTLYINWAAAMQIQFHVDEVNQSFTGSMKEWCYAYIRSFVNSAGSRINTMREKFIEPFLKYLDNQMVP